MATRKGEVAEYINIVVLPLDSDECLLWPYATNALGYGICRHHGKSSLAHRAILIEKSGRSPSDLEAAHICGVPSCVNWRHLRWATSRENNHDKYRHGTVVRGVDVWQARLDESSVLAIRNWFAGGVSCEDLAADHGVSLTTIKNAVYGKSWTHVGGPIADPPSRAKKLTESDVLRIRAMAKRGLRNVDIASHFGISSQHASDISRRLKWAHVQEEGVKA